MRGVRAFLLVNAAAVAAVAAATLLALGLPLATGRRLGAAEVGLLAAIDAVAVFGVAVALLFRGVARPVERLLASAARLGPRPDAPGGDLPILGDPAADAGGQALARAAVAFERVAVALRDDRAALARNVEELTAANGALAEARESLLRTEKLATVGRLAAGLAHEVGNPLGAVAGYVDLARARLPPEPHPDLPDALDRIARAAARIDRTVRDLLDFARPAPAALAPTALAGPVDASIRLARVQARFRGVAVEVHLAPSLPRVVADEHLLSQVLLNLLLNAGDALGGEGSVRVTGHADDRAGGRSVVLRVEDDGPGIPAGDLARVFDPFFTTKEPGQGSGLGLAICHRIMESFGGEITARNGARGGAVFELRFPAEA